MYNLPGFKQLIELLNWVLVHLEHFLASLGLGPNWTWGLAIIGLTIIVRLILFPLTWKQFSSAQAMQAVQPKLKELQKKYKGDRAKLQAETMKLYQEHRVNPFASCLPIILQLPVFISLYYAIKGTPYLDPANTKAPGQRGLPVDPAPGPAGPDLHHARPLRGHAAHLHRAHAHAADGQVAEDDHARDADLLRVHPVSLPGRPVRVLGHDQHLDDRPAADHQEGHEAQGAGAGAGRSSRRRAASWRRSPRRRRTARKTRDDLLAKRKAKAAELAAAGDKKAAPASGGQKKGARKPPPGKGKKKTPPPASGTDTNKNEPADG